MEDERVTLMLLSVFRSGSDFLLEPAQLLTGVHLPGQDVHIVKGRGIACSPHC